MTIGEFKAFIDGMGVPESPNKEQWTRILEKLAEVKPPLYAVPNTLELPTELGMPPYDPPYTVT